MLGPLSFGANMTASVRTSELQGRLDGVAGDVGFHTVELQDHGKMLAEHATALARHQDMLSRLEEGQRSVMVLITTSQSVAASVQISIATLQTLMDTMKLELAHINGWQIKLISFLVIVLAIMAGVSEASKLGLL